MNPILVITVPAWSYSLYEFTDDGARRVCDNIRTKKQAVSLAKHLYEKTRRRCGLIRTFEIKREKSS